MKSKKAKNISRKPRPKAKPKTKLGAGSKPIRPKSGIEPLFDRVLVRPFTEAEAKGEKENKFGIILPESVTKEKSAQGRVLAVGSKVEDLKAGDRVVFSKYAYDEVFHNGEELYLLKVENILAIIR